MKKNSLSSNDSKKIGLVLATVHAGSSQKVWESAANAAKKHNCSFFIFPGGKLDNSDKVQILQNKIYSLANEQNLDGLISWASSIGGTISIPELAEFHKQFSSIPFVTIGQKIEGHSLVKFDAYTGMKKLVEHFIHHHAVRRIAFVRGPANHSSAEDRFRAYCDAIRENDADGIDVKLVSSCCSWYEAQKAAEELFEERGLIPGRDFDALIAASDLMASVVVDYLAQHGYFAPRDYLVGGFNDSEESRAAQVPFSTVRMPQAELGAEAVNLLFQILLGETPRDKALSAFPIIRESCGCNSIFRWTIGSEFRGKIENRQQLKNELFRIFCNFGVEFRAKIESLLELFFSSSRDEFFLYLDETLESYFEKEGELSYIFDAISAIRSSVFIDENKVKNTIRVILVMVSSVFSRVSAKKRHDFMIQGSQMSSLKTALLSVHNRATLLRLLKEHLPKMGIRVCALILYGNDGISRYIGGFNLNEKNPRLDSSEISFDKNLLFPKQISSDFERGIFLIQPLFGQNRSFGHIVLEQASLDGKIFEDLRGSISNALQNIFLFEELEQAKILAEQAEFEKTEFFAAVGSELLDPLKDLSAKVSQMESNINAGLEDSELLSDQLLFIRSQIEAQLEKTETLVDLTRSQVDDLPMDKRLFDVRQILPASISSLISSDVPLLFGDLARLKKAFDSIFDEDDEICEPSVEFDVNGLHIRFSSNHLDWGKPELQLVEKIVLLQYGEIRHFREKTEISFPLPNLGGLPPAKISSGKMLVRSISNVAQESIFGEKILPVTNDVFNDSSLDKNVFLWNPDDAPIDEWIKVYSFRRSDKLFRSPVICFSRMFIGHTFLEILEEKVKLQKSKSVLFVGAKCTKYGNWATDSNSVSIQSMEYFDRILAEITPSLIVFEEMDEDAIVQIRQNVRTVLVPILILPEEVLNSATVERLCKHPRVIVCNREVAEAEPFANRVLGILSGDEILPPNTGALVKRAILYLNQNVKSQIVRWKLADAVNVSEDYLTRIFHRELGLSLWEYLNRYRICISRKLLLETTDSVYEIAERSGFQDQAYFCRVFKKIYGISPGKIRQKF